MILTIYVKTHIKKKMKAEESGMPDEKLWNTFFKPYEILQKMELSNTIFSIVKTDESLGGFYTP